MRCWSQQHNVSDQMDHEEAASVSWMISFRSSSITSWRHKCDSGQTHMDADAGLRCSSSPSSFPFPQPPALPFVDLAFPLNLLTFRCRYDVIVDEIEKENQSFLFQACLLLCPPFSSALVPRCSLDVNPRFRTAVNIVPPNLKEHNWHLWFGLTMTKNQKEAWKGVNRLFKWAFLPNN